MTDLSNPKNCEAFSMLLSCDIDDELSSEQQSRLFEHLTQCNRCRELKSRFDQIDELVGKMGDSPECGMETCDFAASKPILEKTKSRRRNRILLRYGSLAAMVAFVALTLSMTIPLQKEAAAEELMVPLVSLAEINSQRIQDQDLLQQSLEFDLRTLRLQIESIDTNDVSDSIRDRLEQLRKKLEDFRQ